MTDVGLPLRGPTQYLSGVSVLAVLPGSLALHSSRLRYGVERRDHSCDSKSSQSSICQQHGKRSQTLTPKRFAGPRVLAGQRTACGRQGRPHARQASVPSPKLPTLRALCSDGRIRCGTLAIRAPVE